MAFVVFQIVEEFGEKDVSLTRRDHLRVMAEQTLSMLESAPKKRIPGLQNSFHET